MAYNPSVSIVDYLKSKGVALTGPMQGFDQRKRIYEKTGLMDQMGDYRGSDTQNLNLIKYLNTNPNLLTGDSVPQPPLTTDKLASDEQKKLAVPQQFRDLVPPTPVVEPTADDILAEVRKRPSVQFGEAGAEQAKKTIETAAESAKGTALESLSNRGLIRSPGMVAGAIKPIDAERVAKELNIDLSLAKIVASAIEQDQAAKLKAETEKANQYSAYLKSQGLVLNPLTGEIEPDKAFQRAEKTQERSEEYLRLAQERLEQTERNNELYRQKLTTDIASIVETGLTPAQQGKFATLTQDYNKDAIIQSANKMGNYLATIQSAGEGIPNPQKDLNLIYSYVKALDYGESAVREGEIKLGIDTGTLKQQLEATYNKLITGKGMLSETQRINYINAAADLINQVNQAAQRKEQQFASRAKVQGLGKAWNDFRGGFEASYDSTGGTGGGNIVTAPDGQEIEIID